MELFKASNQWASRPADERFGSLDELYTAVKARKDRAAVADVPFGAISAREFSFVGETAYDLAIVGPSGNPAGLTNWSFSQLCRRVGAPSEYLATLPRYKVAELLNYGIEQADEREKSVELLVDVNGGSLVRAVTSQRYTRIWDADVVARLIRFKEDGWRVPPARPAFADQPGTRPATEDDVLDGGAFGLSINVGDAIAPAGLYAGDRDSFFFLVNEKFRISDGTPEGLARGFFVENSEVGHSAFKVTTFLYRHVCGNHIVWDAKDVRKLAVRHVGSADDRAFGELRGALAQYANDSASEDEARIERCKAFRIAAKKEDVVDVAFKIADVSRKSLVAAYDRAETEGEDPGTAWGLAQGVTRISQAETFAEKRDELDRAAGRILRIAF